MFGVGELRTNLKGVPPTALVCQLLDFDLNDAADVASDRESFLESIFERLHQKDATQLALKELFDFTIEHPQVAIQPHIDKCRTVFQGYITRGLARCLPI